MDQVVTAPVAKQSKNCNMQYELFDLGNRQIIESPEREAEMKKFINDLGLAGQKQLIVDQDQEWGMSQERRTAISSEQVC